MSHSHCAGKPLFQYLGFHYIWYIACINPFANYYLVTMLSHPLTWLLFSNPFSISTAVYAVHGKEDSVTYVVLIFFIFKKPYLVTSTNNMWINDPSICLVHVQYSATQHGAAIISSTRVCYMNSSFSFMVINIHCNMLGNQDLSHSL